LHKLFHWEVEVVNFFTSNKPNSTNDERPTTAVVSFHEENLLPQTKVGLNAQERFTDGNKNGKMKD
jgi:hypothetical protein